MGLTIFHRPSDERNSFISICAPLCGEWGINMQTIREEIAKNLLYYRKKSGMTQKQLAELIGVKNTAVSNWESGNNSIDIDTLALACEIFGVTLNDMYGRYTPTEDTYTPHEKEVIVAYRNHPNMQEAVDTLLGITSEANYKK